MNHHFFDPFLHQAESGPSSFVTKRRASVGGEGRKDGEEGGRDQQEDREVQPDCAKHASPKVPCEPRQGG